MVKTVLPKVHLQGLIPSGEHVLITAGSHIKSYMAGISKLKCYKKEKKSSRCDTNQTVPEVIKVWLCWETVAGRMRQCRNIISEKKKKSGYHSSMENLTKTAQDPRRPRQVL